MKLRESPSEQRFLLEDDTFYRLSVLCLGIRRRHPRNCTAQWDSIPDSIPYLFLKKSLITWQVLNQNFLLITWGQYQKGFLYLRKKGKKMPGDDRRGRVKREITKLAPFALVTVPKSSFFLTCMLIHAQAKWPCHEGVFLIPHVSHYWKCWLHSLSESWKKKSYNRQDPDGVTIHMKLSRGAICFSAFYKIKFGIFV